ncbi:MAG: TlpA disulfide reductase family protein [Bacteroidota bacterium]|nr:TlpA disulfide reductase family protein [Bacteroidota bacterium]
MKKTLIFLLPVIILAGCHNKSTFTISGITKDKSQKAIYLNRVNVNTLVFVDSSEIRKNGKFSLRIRAKEPDFYQLGYSNTNFVTLLAGPGEKIYVTFNGKSLISGYSISGSEGSEKVRMLDMRLADTRKKLDSLRTVYAAAAKEPDFDKKGPALETEFENTLKDIRKKNIEFIIGNLKSMASIMAIYQKIDNETYVLYDPRDLQYMKLVSDTLGRYYPNSLNVLALKEDLRKELNLMNSSRLETLAASSPQVRLDPNLKNVSGKRIALSSLKGKVVLLTFWSVECKECIAENLQLKNVYKALNKKGFEIYQVNLDQDEEAWKKEVRFDELPWISTREDDPSNPLNARLFNVKAIPANFLYDRSGNIIAKDLHGKSLQIRLDQLFGN